MGYKMSIREDYIKMPMIFKLIDGFSRLGGYF